MSKSIWPDQNNGWDFTEVKNRKKNLEEKPMAKFEAGKTYSTSSICDHTCIFSFKIIRRTEKSVWVTGNQIKEPTRKGLYMYNGKENFKPYGTYSMCPIIQA